MLRPSQRALLLFRTSTARSASTEFAELYGRARRIDEEEQNSLTSSTSCFTSTRGAVQIKEPPLRWREKLEAFRTAQYVSPHEVSFETCLGALDALRAALDAPAQRNAKQLHKVWRDALEVAQHVKNVSASPAHVHCAFVLFYTQQYSQLRSFVEHLLHHLHAPNTIEMGALEFGSCLRLLSVYFLCTSELHCVPSPRLQVLTTQLLVSSKEYVRRLSKEQRHDVVAGVGLLLWAVDWLHHFAEKPCRPDSRQLDELRATVPSWMPFLFLTPSELQALPVSAAMAPQSPPSLLRVRGEQLATSRDLPGLHQLYSYVVEQRERTSRDFAVFSLSPRLGELLLRVAAPGDRVWKTVVDGVGSSLHPRLLAEYGRHPRGYRHAVRVLTTLTGPSAYEALKHVLFNRPMSELAEVQEEHGDVLTGSRQTTWATALAATSDALAIGDSSWRATLPETLRLLSDAGKHRDFYQLLPEYSAAGGEDNLRVAAALGQTVRRTGKWWQALDVLDLVANARVPQEVMEESFLHSACTDTLCALRNARRWREALELFRALKPVMPAAGQHVLCSVVAEMPPSAPWEAALAYVADNCPADGVCETVTAQVSWARGVAPVPRAHGDQKRAVRLLAENGHWRPLVDFTRSGVGGKLLETWKALLHAVEMADGDDVQAFPFDELPHFLLEDVDVLKQAYHVALHRGWLSSLLVKLTATSTPLCQQYRVLVQFALTETLLVSEVPSLTDSFVVHSLTAFLTARSFRIAVPVPSPPLSSPGVMMSADRIASALRIPHACVGKVKKTEFILRPLPRLSVPPRYVLHATDQFVVGFKAPGASAQSTARGLLHAAAQRGVFVPAYLLPAGASGLCVLLRASTEQSSVQMELDVVARLAPLGPSHTALLSAVFFRHYRLQPLAGSVEKDGVVTVSLRCCGHGVHGAKECLRRLKADLNAEGWGFVEATTGDGDTFHVSRVRLTSHASDGDAFDWSYRKYPRWVRSDAAEEEEGWWVKI